MRRLTLKVKQSNLTFMFELDIESKPTHFHVVNGSRVLYHSQASTRGGPLKAEANALTCGMQLSGGSMVNSTCNINGDHIKAIYAGNGAFITGEKSMTGYEGISGNADLIVFFEQYCDEWGCNNSTCWGASLDCVDDGIATAGVYFMETVSAAQAGVINLQIAGVNKGDSIAITLNDDFGVPVGLTNITSHGGIVSSEEGPFGSFSITAGQNFGTLLQVSVNTEAVVNLWKSVVAKEED